MGLFGTKYSGDDGGLSWLSQPGKHHGGWLHSDPKAKSTGKHGVNAKAVRAAQAKAAAKAKATAKAKAAGKAKGKK